MLDKIKKLYLKHKEIISYLIVGFLTTIVSLGTYYTLRNLIFRSDRQLDIQMSNIFAFILAVLFSYVLNHSWVFQSKKSGKDKKKEFTAFFVSRIFTLLIDAGLMFILPVYMKINDKIAKLIVQVVITIANYLIGKYIVFQGE